MKKLHLLSCLLMVIAAMTACSESEDLTIPAPSGQFVYNGVSHELHYASRHGFYGTINSMSLLFSSAAGHPRRRKYPHTIFANSKMGWSRNDQRRRAARLRNIRHDGIQSTDRRRQDTSPHNSQQ